ncbi:hypothetical protein GGF32_005332 [Allomyces javanicus]|nr:hypothetical protein GGF32_005332 [Allomyces javanicus]
MDSIHKSKDISFHPSMVQTPLGQAGTMAGADWNAVPPTDPRDPPLNLADWEAIVHRLAPIQERPVDNQQPTLVFYAFFSRANVDEIQRGIRYIVFKRLGRKIATQDEDELTNLMQAVYVDHAENVAERRLGRKTVARFVRRQVAKLNAIVADYAAESVLSNIVSHEATQQQRQTDRALDQRPSFSSVTGLKEYRSVDSVLQRT